MKRFWTHVQTNSKSCSFILFLAGCVHRYIRISLIQKRRQKQFLKRGRKGFRLGWYHAPPPMSLLLQSPIFLSTRFYATANTSKKHRHRRKIVGCVTQSMAKNTIGCGGVLVLETRIIRIGKRFSVRLIPRIAVFVEGESVDDTWLIFA